MGAGQLCLNLILNTTSYDMCCCVFAAKLAKCCCCCCVAKADIKNIFLVFLSDNKGTMTVHLKGGKTGLSCSVYHVMSCDNLIPPGAKLKLLGPIF